MPAILRQRRVCQSGWFVRKLEGTPHWVQIVELFNQTSRGQPGSGCTRDERMEITNQSSKSPYSCHVRRIVLTRNVENVYLGPLIGKSTEHNLPKLLALHSCIEQLVRHEEHVRRGIRYEQVVHSRLDRVWIASHPPVAVLDPKYVWIPGGQDYQRGVCDRHAFMNRSSAHVYFRRWDFLLDGRVMRIDSQFASGRLNSMLQMNDENYLADSLAFYRLPIRRFPSASFLGCCPPSLHSCFRSRCLQLQGLRLPRKAQGLCAASAVNETFSPPVGGSRLLRVGAKLGIGRNHLLAAPDECERHVGTNDPAALVAAALANNYSIAGKYHMEMHWGVQIAFLLEFPSTKWVTVAVAEPKHWPRVGLGGVGLRIDARTHATLMKVVELIVPWSPPLFCTNATTSETVAEEEYFTCGTVDR
ncbi:hypothetical protein EMIHUDRAFT_253701 [Emiliania huxleyi CCMP1516]|uniref:Uncharacterized protein n=2 Tax=Emiliania huxleyi TaxID=2903 RepID=A0A0D3K437_EMIH1|nr:hypothetical protein EMIHUDRAFT_253701 [Emiliania huxleyi CCMP1516]EOD30522.1 hypothetical protein EMIHUDRAFT_253701 [Emiliania huxleyi CCMP1516]|eukprot:XP_005782951.1 hypothetical protein EMIHUDRAFT_253701 [Emiliania huxleyi CCMP1516]